MKKLIMLAALFMGCSCEEPRANCYTCVTRCHPFKVASCEPAWSRLNPIYCSCDPFNRLDEPPATISPVKEARR